MPTFYVLTSHHKQKLFYKQKKKFRRDFSFLFFFKKLLSMTLTLKFIFFSFYSFLKNKEKKKFSFHFLVPSVATRYLNKIFLVFSLSWLYHCINCQGRNFLFSQWPRKIYFHLLSWLLFFLLIYDRNLFIF